jgi:hypothetical protein
MVTPADEIDERVIKFQQSRRNAETREYVRCIINALERARGADISHDILDNDAGWVRVKTLFDDLVGKTIPHQTTFYRLLEDLKKAKIIRKQVKITPGETGRRSTYYQVPCYYRNSLFMSREELENAYYEFPISIIKRLLVAEEMLNELKGNNLSLFEIKTRLTEKQGKDLELLEHRSRSLFKIYENQKEWEKRIL